jgi:hypothetical protein
LSRPAGGFGPSLVPLLLDAGGVGAGRVRAVYLLIGAVAIVAVITVAVFGDETKGRTLESITAPQDRLSAPDRTINLVGGAV